MLVSGRLMSSSVVTALPRCHVLALFLGKKGVEGIEQPQTLHHSNLLGGCWKTEHLQCWGQEQDQLQILPLLCG